MLKSKCSDEVGRKTSNQLGVSGTRYTGLDVPRYQSQIREGGAFYVLGPLFFTTFIARNILLDGVWGASCSSSVFRKSIVAAPGLLSLSLKILLSLPSLHTSVSRQCM